MFLILGGGKTRYPRYYSGPADLKRIVDSAPTRDSGPFAGIVQATRFNTEEQAQSVANNLPELYKLSPRWNREEIMGLKVVEVK